MSDSKTDLELRLLLEAIYGQYHCDFRNYSMASLRRRMAQALPQFAVKSISELQSKILHQPESFAPLLGYLTVQVSDMFRDPSYFAALRGQVMPHLATYPSLKIWVAGCSTGEEAYSIAIVLKEVGLLERSLIYATDINPDSLRKAQSGIYPLERMREFTENHRQSGGIGSLSEHYHAVRDSAVMDPILRRRITFSDHSLATDSIFSEVQLVSCRNVLIYFNRDLQNRALKLFVESLCSRGFLGLGSKETLRFSEAADAFAEFVAPARIYRKLP